MTVEDQFGNTVTSGADSTINVTMTIQTGTGTLQGTVTKAAVAGVATFTNLRIDPAGAKTLRASGTLTGPGAVSVDSASFTVAAAGAASQLVYTTQPAGATAGAAFGTQPVVTVEDAFGNTVTTGADSTINVTASIQTGTGSLQGTVTQAAVAGVATFGNLRIDTSGAKTLRASGTLAGPGSVTTDSSSFTVGVAAASQLVYTTQPAGAIAGTAFGTQPAVIVEDAFGNTVTTGADSTINISVAIQTGTGSLQGTVTQAAVAGVASFTNLRIDTTGAKTLRASGTLAGPGAVTVDSAGFTVSAAAAAQLVYTTQPAGATAGSAFGTQPVVTVEDAFGNTVTTGADSTINVSVAIQTGTGSLQGTATKTAVAGVATFTNLRIDSSGAKTLRASGSLSGPGAVTVDSSSFAVNVAAASQLVYTTQPAGATAGAAFGTQPVVTVEDAFGNTVTTGADSTINITAAIQTGTGSLQGTLTKSAVAGVATFTNLRIDTTGAKTLRASGTLAGPGPVTIDSASLNVSSDAAFQLVYTTQPAGATAGSNLGTQPVVTVEDQFGNTVTSGADSTINVTMSIFSGGGTLQGTTIVAAVAGVATYTNLRIDSSGAHTLNASGTLSIAGAVNLNSSSFTISPAAASQLAYTTQPAGATAGSVFGTQPVVIVEDGFGNAITGGADSTINVTVGLQSGTGSLQGTVTRTATAGVATFTNLRIDTTGAKTLRASGTLSGPGAVTVDSNSFTVSAAAGSQLAYTTQPAGAAAGAAFGTQPVVTVQDAFGNTVTSGADSTINVTMTIQTGTGTLQGTVTKTAVAGVATFTNLRIDPAGAKTLRASGTLSGPGAVTVDSSSFAVSAAAASQIVVTTDPAGATAGSAFATQPVVTVEDAFGNTVTTGADSTINITMTIQTGTGTLQGTATKAAVAGVATFTNLRIDTTGAKTLRAAGTLTGPGAVTDDSASFTVDPATVASQLVYTTQPSGATAGAVFGTQPVVTVEDAFGNTVTTGADSTINVSIAIQTGTGTLQGTVTQAAVAGVATFTNLRIDSSGAKTLRASGTISGPGAVSVDSSSFAVAAGAASQLVYTTQPAGATAGAAFVTQPIATVEDTFGNVVTTGADSTINVSVALQTGSGTLQGTVTQPAVAGVATFTNLRIDSSGAKTLRASGTLSGPGAVTADSNSFTVAAASASQLVYTGQPAGATAGSAFGSQPVVSVEDAFGNTITAGADSTINVTMTIQTGTGASRARSPRPPSPASPPSPTSASTPPAPRPCAPPAPSPAPAPSPSTPRASPSAPTPRASSSIQRSLRARPRALPSGRSRSSRLRTSSATRSPQEPIRRSTSPSHSRAVAARSRERSRRPPSPASPPSPTSGSTRVAPRPCAPPAPSPAPARSLPIRPASPSSAAAASQVVVTTDPAGATAGSAFATQPVVTVEDQFANTVTTGADSTINVTMTIQTGTGSLQGTVTKAAVAGVATFTNLRIDSSGAKTLRAAGTLTGPGAVTDDSASFTVAAAAASQLVYTTQPSAATAGSAFGVQPVLAVEDVFGNTVTSGADSTINVTVGLQTGSGSLQGTVTKAAVAGVASFTNLRIDASGAKTLRASGTLSGSGAVTVDSSSFTVSADAASQLIVTTQPAGATAGAPFGTQPAVTVEDQFGNTVTTGLDSTINITAALQSGTGSLQGTATKTAVAGVATFTNLRIDASGAKMLRALGSLSGPGAVSVDSNSFTVSADAAGQLVYTTQPAGATAGSALATQPVVTVEDAFGNTITTGADSTINITVALQSGTGTLQGTVTKTAVAGVATFTNLRIDASGAKTLRAAGTLTGPGAITVDSASFTVSSGAAAELIYTTQPAGATAGSTFATQPVVTVEDAYGNRVATGPDSAINITMSIFSGGGTLQGTTSVAAIAGIATYTNLRIDTSSTHTLAASGTLSIPGAVSANSSSFTINQAAASQLDYTTQPTGATAGSAFATQPVVTVEDAYGNTVTTGPDSTINITAAIQTGAGASRHRHQAAVAGRRDLHEPPHRHGRRRPCAPPARSPAPARSVRPPASPSAPARPASSSSRPSPRARPRARRSARSRSSRSRTRTATRSRPARLDGQRHRRDPDRRRLAPDRHQARRRRRRHLHEPPDRHEAPRPRAPRHPPGAGAVCAALHQLHRRCPAPPRSSSTRPSRQRPPAPTFHAVVTLEGRDFSNPHHRRGR